MWMAATPARSISRTVRAMLNALPKPVSTSTSSGSSVAAVMRRASSSTSPSVVTPKIRQAERRVRDAGARQIQRLETGVAAASSAQYALIAPGICSGALLRDEAAELLALAHDCGTHNAMKSSTGSASNRA